ncbi:MAG: DUF362 domain-containing protein [Bryobacteraceae bacterium]|nr:DUF362 domain-containing protein [Bryobacteraceae bacterium]MDW8377382.1 DUF362 domain-containing protein [Bryobacterales bacterium]
MTRRDLLFSAGFVPALSAQDKRLPTAPVALAKAPSYSDDLASILTKMFDQIGGAGRLVRNKTVTIKLNLTGSPALRFQGKPLGVTHYTHPKTVAAMVHVLSKAGARRIRLVESAWATAGPLEEYLLDSGWNVRQLMAVAPNLEFENTNALGQGKRYYRFRVPGGGLIFPAYDLNHSYHDTDVFVSMAKLKNHDTCGVTLAMKNIFGITPASIYGDDAGVDEPNENPTKGRAETCHFGRRQPARVAPGELNPASDRSPGYRMPRITAELVAARPIDISFIDGIETMTGGEGPWIRKSLGHVKPGVLILGTNPVNTDAVATAVMGYNPRAGRGSAPFQNCDNTLLLAEQLGLGSAKVDEIEVVGETIAAVRYPFPG